MKKIIAITTIFVTVAALALSIFTLNGKDETDSKKTAQVDSKKDESMPLKSFLGVELGKPLDTVKDEFDLDIFTPKKKLRLFDTYCVRKTVKNNVYYIRADVISIPNISKYSNEGKITLDREFNALKDALKKKYTNERMSDMPETFKILFSKKSELTLKRSPFLSLIYVDHGVYDRDMEIQRQEDAGTVDISAL